MQGRQKRGKGAERRCACARTRVVVRLSNACAAAVLGEQSGVHWARKGYGMVTPGTSRASSTISAYARATTCPVLTVGYSTTRLRRRSRTPGEPAS
eukprot:301272-Rhodomonas_salina.1